MLLTALFVGVALLLYNRQRARTLGKASPHEFAHLIAGAALIVDILCLTYIYGKSIRNFTFDEIKFERANTKPTEYGVGLLLSENDKTMIVYDEAEGLPDEVPNTTKSPQGKKDLIHECIAYSNRKAEAPK